MAKATEIESEGSAAEGTGRRRSKLGDNKGIGGWEAAERDSRLCSSTSSRPSSRASDQRT